MHNSAGERFKHFQALMSYVMSDLTRKHVECKKKSITKKKPLKTQNKIAFFFMDFFFELIGDRMEL